MTEEQINTLARYLGNKFSFTSQGELHELAITCLSRLFQVDKGLEGWTLHLNPLASLTQEDFERMLIELRGWGDAKIRSYHSLKDWLSLCEDNQHLIPVRDADWLRNNGYYLGEESINEFVKLK
jgi:hypothetical protein